MYGSRCVLGFPLKVRTFRASGAMKGFVQNAIPQLEHVRFHEGFFFPTDAGVAQTRAEDSESRV